MAFIEVFIKTDDSAFADIIIAELAEIGFDTFEEDPNGVKAYVAEENFQNILLDDLVQQYEGTFQFDVSVSKVEKENWNALWEKNYDPIDIDDRCIVRASFHETDKTYDHEIIINPKMSFGTGHHATTWQMLKLLLDVEVEGKNVLDVGCGTGVLAILAAIRGAKTVNATDIDEWCIQNGKENFELNGVSQIDIQLGSIDKLNFDVQFDLVLANINKNVLLNEIPDYVRLMAPGGCLMLSGFYVDDIPDIEKICHQNGLKLEKSSDRNDWAALLFVPN